MDGMHDVCNTIVYILCDSLYATSLSNDIKLLLHVYKMVFIYHNTYMFHILFSCKTTVLHGNSS